MVIERPQLRLPDKLAAWSSWLLAGALFLTVGWRAMEPDDPLGAVSVLTHRGTLAMLAQAAVLAGAVAALATVIAGRKLADVGTFGAAIGLAAVSLRGSTIEYLLVQGADVSAPAGRGLALKLAVEAMGWFVVMMLSLGISALVMRWCFKSSVGPTFQSVKGEGEGPSDTPSRRLEPARTPAQVMSACDVPGLGVRLFGTAGASATPPAEGIKHAIITAGTALLAFNLLSSGLYSRSIQHGQTCFVVAAAVCIGCYVAYRLVPVRSALWSILAVVSLAVVGYLWASLRPATVALPANIPASHFMRVLPIQYISVGTAAAIAMFWYMCVPIVTWAAVKET